MNRDFKEEYQDYTAQDLPDLWNRIESNLTPRDQIQPEDQEIPGMTDASVEKTAHEVLQRSEHKSKYRFRTVFATAAALAVLLLSAKIIQSGMFGTNASDVAMEADCEETAEAAGSAQEEVFATEEAVGDAAEEYEAQAQAPANESYTQSASDGYGEEMADVAPEAENAETNDMAMRDLASEESSKGAAQGAPSKESALSDEAKMAQGGYVPLTSEVKSYVYKDAVLSEAPSLLKQSDYGNRFDTPYALTFELSEGKETYYIRAIVSKAEYEALLGETSFETGKRYDITVEASSAIDELHQKVDAHLIRAAMKK